MANTQLNHCIKWVVCPGGFLSTQFIVFLSFFLSWLFWRESLRVSFFFSFFLGWRIPILITEAGGKHLISFFPCWMANTQLHHWANRGLQPTSLVGPKKLPQAVADRIYARPQWVTKSSQCLWASMHPRANRFQQSNLCKYQETQRSLEWCPPH